jgi:hypothetical protein
MTDGQPVIDEWKQICENKDKVFSVFTDEILQEFHEAPLWCFEANSFNPASKYILIKTGKTFFKICQSPGYGSTQSKLLPYSDLSLIKCAWVENFFSIPEESTEKSQFTSLAILDESADSKETVLKVVNILHEKFQVGICTDFSVCHVSVFCLSV